MAGAKPKECTPEIIALAKDVRARGNTDADVWPVLGIGKNLYYQWKRDNEEFSEAIEEGKRLSIANIAKTSLSKLARGYSVKKTSVSYKFDNERFKQAKEETGVDPDPARFWVPDYMTVSEQHFSPNIKAIEKLVQLNDPNAFEPEEHDIDGDSLVVNMSLNMLPTENERSEYTDEIDKFLNDEMEL